jgi:hypothetical protein
MRDMVAVYPAASGSTTGAHGFCPALRPLRTGWSYCLAVACATWFIVGCSETEPADAVLELNQIHNVSKPSDLVNRSSSSRLYSISAKAGRRVADRQATVWAKTPTLIGVMVSNRVEFLTASSESNKVVEWLYIYRDQTATAWLAVTVDADGVIDAGQCRAPSFWLRDWSGIRDWDYEPDALAAPSDFGDTAEFRLYGTRAGDAVWLEVTKRRGWDENRRYVNGRTGDIAIDVERPPVVKGQWCSS